MSYTRAQINKEFRGLEINRENVREWLTSINIGGSDLDNGLNEVFSENETFESITKFVQKIEDLVINGGAKDNILTNVELEDVFGTKISDNPAETTQPSRPAVSTQSSKPAASSAPQIVGLTSANNEKDVLSYPAKKPAASSAPQIVGLTSTNNQKDVLSYPANIKSGDSGVLSLSYSEGGTNIDIEALRYKGWTVAYEKNMGGGDRVILILTKEMDGTESEQSFTIPTKGNMNDVSAQMTVLRGMNIDTSNIEHNSDDGSKEKTIFEKNTKNQNAKAYLHVGMSDDPTEYRNQMGVGYFGTSYHGDDAGVSFISNENGKYTLNGNYLDGGGRQDLMVNIPIVNE